MNATRDGARMALENAATTFEAGETRAAAMWSRIAAETISAAAITPDEQRRLVAPKDEDTPLGEKVAFGVVVLIIVGVVVDVLVGAMA